MLPRFCAARTPLLGVAEVSLDQDKLREIAEALPLAAGDRYDPGGMRSVNI